MPARADTRLSVLSKARVADMVLEPYPHIVIKNALEEALYTELVATLPSENIIIDGRPVKDTWYDFPACRVLSDQRIPALWKEFFAYHTSSAFFRELIYLAGHSIRQLYPELESLVGRSLEGFRVGMRPGGRGNPFAPNADVSMECQFYINYTRKPRAVRGPHVDRPSELFAALLYMRDPTDDSRGGNLEICEAIDPIFPRANSVRIAELPAEIAPKSVKTVKTVTYEANTLVLFLNSPRSIHAVSPRTPTTVPRRHINFCCDLNFDLFKLDLPMNLKARQFLAKAPVLWRLSKLF